MPIHYYIIPHISEVFILPTNAAEAGKTKKTKPTGELESRRFLVDQIREASWCSYKLNTVPDSVLLS